MFVYARLSVPWASRSSGYQLEPCGTFCDQCISGLCDLRMLRNRRAARGCGVSAGGYLGGLFGVFGVFGVYFLVYLGILGFILGSFVILQYFRISLSGISFASFWFSWDFFLLGEGGGREGWMLWGKCVSSWDNSVHTSLPLF